jgi:hypothetical protein
VFAASGYGRQAIGAAHLKNLMNFPFATETHFKGHLCPNWRKTIGLI